jgi:hypothetical protein
MRMKKIECVIIDWAGTTVFRSDAPAGKAAA